MRWTLVFEDDDTGKVTMTTEPKVDKATLAHHIAQLKVNGRGLGPAFDYLVLARNYATLASKGKAQREKLKDRDTRLIITPDS